MSKFGWRWWDLTKSGQLTSVNGLLWEPSEELHAECGRAPRYSIDPTRYNDSVGAHHRATLITASGELHMLEPDSRRVLRPGRRKGGGEIVVEGVPGENCTCGFWAYHDPEGAYALPHLNGGYLVNCKVFGVIEAWGGIMDHELGFRCEYAAVRAVHVVRGKLHAAYEVSRYSSFAEIVKVWDVSEDEELAL